VYVNSDDCEADASTVYPCLFNFMFAPSPAPI